MRIGIFGGTFDPVHYGHLIAAEAAREGLVLDRVLFVPARISPHKLGIVPASIDHRLRMLTLATESNPFFCVSTVDVDRPGPSYTVETVALLRQQHEHDELYFILGADSLATLGAWKEPARLLQLARLAVLNRPGYCVEAGSLPDVAAGVADRVRWIAMPAIGISGEDLRARVAAGRSIRYQVPEAIAQYIRAHSLYRRMVSRTQRAEAEHGGAGSP